MVVLYTFSCGKAMLTCTHLPLAVNASACEMLITDDFPLTLPPALPLSPCFSTRRFAIRPLETSAIRQSDMASSRLEALAPELQLMIFEVLTRPTDLRSVCLTSRKLCNLATPILYEDPPLDIEASVRSHPRGYFGARNPGSIRGLAFKNFTSEDVDDHAMQEFVYSSIVALNKDQLASL